MKEQDSILGTRVGRYRIERLLGEGTMGEVYEAVDTSGERVALKVLKPGEPEWSARFVRECELAATIRSEYVARVVRAGKNRESRYWIAFELLSGETLDTWLRRERTLPLADAEWVIDQLLAGLEAAHALGIVHRDIKPSNLFVEASPRRLKILDFGIARQLASSSTTSVPLTQVGALLGTPSYMSPEQFLDPSHVDARSDVYSAGLVAYRALAGALPFGTTDPAVLLLRKKRDIPSLAAVTGCTWAEGIEAWIQQTTARDPEARFATASAARVAWETACVSARRHVQAATPLAGFCEPTDAVDDDE